MISAGLPRRSLAAAFGLGAGVLVSQPSLVHWPRRVRPGVGLVVGGVTTFLAAALLDVARLLAPSPMPPDRRALVRRGLVRRAAIAGTAAASVGVMGGVGLAVLTRRYERHGRVIDPAFAVPPRSVLVSGSDGSLVRCDTLAREGARFVHAVTAAESIEQIWGEPVDAVGLPPIIEPIRVFVGVDSATAIANRVDLAMAELTRTRAFERSVLLIVAPAGSGYANPLPASVLEIASRGDCAIVVVAYGVKPSLMSLDRIPSAVDTQVALLQSITRHLAAMPPDARPRLLLYGESLGARVQQGALKPERIRAGAPVEEMPETWIDRALWVGTPGGVQRDRFRAGLTVAQVSLDRPEQIDASDPAIVWFLEHDADPVVLFTSELMVRRPRWLTAAGRGEDIPQRMKWWPVLTWVQVFVDTIFATKIEPGRFDRLGHDYRADLGAVTCAAYGLSMPSAAMRRLEPVLRALEVTRAERIGSMSPPGDGDLGPLRSH